MSAIHSHLTGSTVFAPAVLTEMSKAFVEACTELHVFAGDNFGRELVAIRIADLARSGVVDAKTLCDRVLLESGSATLARLPSSLSLSKNAADPEAVGGCKCQRSWEP